MAKTKQISNVRIRAALHNGSQLFAGFEYNGGYRYHVWLDSGTLAIAHGTGKKFPTLYRNPPKGVENMGGKTALLDATRKDNAKLVAAMFTEIESNNLIEKAKQEADALKNKRLEQAHDEYKIHVQQEAGPGLLEVLKELLNAQTEFARKAAHNKAVELIKHTESKYAKDAQNV